MEKLTADVLRAALKRVTEENKDPWPFIESSIIEILGRVEKLESRVVFLRSVCEALAKENKSLREAPAPVSVDGAPLDAAQAEAESVMNAAAVVPAPVRGGRRVQPATPTVGADGTPLDAAQAAAEAAMEAAAGPRA